MKWYKHHSDFRTSPGMKYIASQLGDHGVAAVYRLYEVFTQRFGLNDDYSGSILLSPPFTNEWLAQEILTPVLSDEQIQEPYRDLNEVPLTQLDAFLQVCSVAGLLQITFEQKSSSQVQLDGSRKDTGVQSWRRLTIPGFSDLKDNWSDENQRKKRTKSMALSTPE